MSSIEETIRSHLKENFPTAADQAIEDDFPLIENGIIDSLGIFIIVPFVQDQFGVEVAPADLRLENFGTIGAIAQMVRAKQAG